MAALRRAALSAVLAAAAWVMPPSQVLSQAPPELRLELTAHYGGLRIVNPGTAPVEIQAKIAVEAREGGGWTAVLTEFNAVARCERTTPDGPVRIAPAAALTVVPWRGFSCSGQCVAACRANLYYGAGPFRFVVTTAPGGERFVSPVFTMPSQPRP